MSGTKFPPRTTISVTLAVLISIFVIYIGISYLLAPQSSAAGFGVPSPPLQSDAFLFVKGVRDIVSGLVILAVVATAPRRVLGWVLLAEALTAIGDMVIVLTSGGAPATAFGIHGATAAVVILAGLLPLTGARTRSPLPA
jgi:hypothetical protein